VARESTDRERLTAGFEERFPCKLELVNCKPRTYAREPVASHDFYSMDRELDREYNETFRSFRRENVAANRARKTCRFFVDGGRGRFMSAGEAEIVVKRLFRRQAFNP